MLGTDKSAQLWQEQDPGETSSKLLEFMFVVTTGMACSHTQSPSTMAVITRKITLLGAYELLPLMICEVM